MENITNEIEEELLRKFKQATNDLVEANDELSQLLPHKSISENQDIKGPTDLSQWLVMHKRMNKALKDYSEANSAIWEYRRNREIT